MNNNIEQELYGSIDEKKKKTIITKAKLKQIIKEELEAVVAERCWDGYERVPNKREGEQGSCRKQGSMNEGEADLESKIRKVLKDEGGAAGLDAIVKGTDASEKEAKAALKAMVDVGLHKNGDYILDDASEIDVKKKLNNGPSLDTMQEEEGKKDACYHKVKARYKVWPSAYASGALVKCRKVGAANWGKSKKEQQEIDNEILEDLVNEELYSYLEEKKQSSEDAGRLDKWFGRKGEKGSKGGWVDCNAPDGKGGYKECAQGDRKKKPYCRPTPSACKKEPKKESLNKIIEQELEAVLDEKKKKPCKPSKGKRFAKRVDGKCRSFGQAGQAKGGGDRIRPGTAKGDAYCARSAKIKKCKNPPCANALSRKKWKCRGSKSVAEGEIIDMIMNEIEGLFKK